MDGKLSLKGDRKETGKIMRNVVFAAFFALLALTSCQTKERTIKVAASPVPHTDLLEAIRPELEDQGIKLKIVEVDDYNLPNRLLYEKQVDANFFQHMPYLEEQNKRFGYNLAPLASVHIEPLGIYSEKIKSLEDLEEGGVVAIPSDPTNEARALNLLSQVGLIKLKPSIDILTATIYDIGSNPKKLKIEEIDAAFLPRILPDVDLAVIPVNFALQANLNPQEDALVIEPNDSPYTNIVVVREEDLDREDLKKFKQVLQSEKMRTYIQEKYKGAIVPAF